MKRMRRLRSSEAMRNLVRETRLHKEQLVYPIFVIEGKNIKNPVESMPGIYQYSIDRLEEECERIRKSGVRNVLLFGIPEHKDEVGSQAYDKKRYYAAGDPLFAGAVSAAFTDRRCLPLRVYVSWPLRSCGWVSYSQ